MKRAPITCTKCGDAGHNARSCTKKAGWPLVALIESKGFTLAQVADEIEHSRGTMSMAVRGQVALSAEALGRIAAAIRVSPDVVQHAYREGRISWHKAELARLCEPEVALAKRGSRRRAS